MRPESSVGPTPDPAVIARCREVLGAEANGLSDADVDLVRAHADAVARLVVEMFLKEPD